MLNFSPGQRNALIFLSCLLGILLLTAGYLRVVRSGRVLHTLFLQPTPMELPPAGASQPRLSAEALPAFPALAKAGAQGSMPLQTALNINAASARELEALPGIGRTLASRIIRYREAHGAFRMVEDLLKVEGIGPRTLERMRSFVICGAG